MHLRISRLNIGLFLLNIGITMLYVILIFPYVRVYFQSPTNAELVTIAEKGLDNFTLHNSTGMSFIIGSNNAQKSCVVYRSYDEATVIVPTKARLGTVTPALVHLVMKKGKWKADSFISKLGEHYCNTVGGEF